MERLERDDADQHPTKNSLFQSLWHACNPYSKTRQFVSFFWKMIFGPWRILPRRHATGGTIHLAMVSSGLIANSTTIDEAIIFQQRDDEDIWFGSWCILP